MKTKTEENLYLDWFKSKVSNNRLLRGTVRVEVEWGWVDQTAVGKNGFWEVTYFEVVDFALDEQTNEPNVELGILDEESDSVDPVELKYNTEKYRELEPELLGEFEDYLIMNQGVLINFTRPNDPSVDQDPHHDMLDMDEWFTEQFDEFARELWFNVKSTVYNKMKEDFIVKLKRNENDND